MTDSAGLTASPSPPRLADPQTLLLVEDDAADAVLVEELLADSGLNSALAWARSLAEAKKRSCWTSTCPTPVGWRPSPSCAPPPPPRRSSC